MKLYKAFERIYRLCCLAACACLAGCGNAIPPNGFGQIDYGPATPTTPPDPDLRLIEISYQPSAEIHVGDQITFTVTANKPSQAVSEVQVLVGYNDNDYWNDNPLLTWIRDDGESPDVHRADGVYTGTLTIPKSYAPHSDLAVEAEAQWWSSATPPSIIGEPLDILPAEGE